jgi:precorrin-3B methylase
LVYALVPKMQLEKIVERRRRHLAVGDLGAVLYNVPGKEYKDLVTAYAQTIKRSRIWRERY